MSELCREADCSREADCIEILPYFKEVWAFMR